ncbi:hypothetical protein CJ671_00240 [Aliarcobacter cryaerophilus]|uniref:Type I restriction modification DNA specificity domain-containing protein n=1 Tax=Aliarcobacter cryaerophilus TaxID=28198 RepID=A0A2S9SW53_9BACT|nr:restriction endonuclease subunit S [Aliarcobacter cryaerophilus]PRM90802.1 hypothetical protein CJ671_00240 [Aliarcobacter cryaerophilus]
MSELYSLPDGWEWKTFDNVLILIQNGISDTQNDEGIGFPISRIETIQNETLDSNRIKYVDISDKSIIEKYRYDYGDILFSHINSFEKVGKVCLYTNQIENLLHGVNLLRMKFIDDLDSRFVFYYLISNMSRVFYEPYIKKAINQASINQKNIKSIPIPLPPLSEQQRIVSKLDNLFEKIDKSIALHQKNIDEADIFMASVLNDVFVELEEKYGLDNIGNMIDILTDYHSNGAYKDLKANVELLDEEDYALMIRATDLENGDYTNNVKYITESAYNFMSKSKVFGGEIILPKIGTIGNVYFMPYLERPVSLAMNLFMLRCSDKVMNKYMFLFLKSPRGNENILNKANGAVTKTITKDAVRSIELPFPPLKTQQKVVAYLDEISQKMDKIKEIQKEKMQSLKELKASILDKAFKGEL